MCGATYATQIHVIFIDCTRDISEKSLKTNVELTCAIKWDDLTSLDRQYFPIIK